MTHENVRSYYLKLTYVRRVIYVVNVKTNHGNVHRKIWSNVIVEVLVAVQIGNKPMLGHANSTKRGTVNGIL